MNRERRACALLSTLCLRYGVKRSEIVLLFAPWFVQTENAYAVYKDRVHELNNHFLGVMLIIFGSLLGCILFGHPILGLVLSLSWFVLFYLSGPIIFMRLPEGKHIILVANIPEDLFDFVLIHEFVHIRRYIDGSDYRLYRWNENITNAEAGIIYKELFGDLPPKNIPMMSRYEQLRRLWLGFNTNVVAHFRRGAE